MMRQLPLNSGYISNIRVIATGLNSVEDFAWMVTTCGVSDFYSEISTAVKYKSLLTIT
jgi:hypothetical protein